MGEGGGDGGGDGMGVGESGVGGVVYAPWGGCIRQRCRVQCARHVAATLALCSEPAYILWVEKGLCVLLVAHEQMPRAVLP